MQVRPADTADTEAILALQRANQMAHLTQAQRADGFLSAEFSEAQLRRMCGGLGIEVACEADVLVGYLCALDCEDQPRAPVIEAMLSAFATARFQGQPLDWRSCYIYGPICVAQAHRGRGVLQRLVHAQCDRLGERYALGVALIAKDNARSLRAHVDKLGMRHAGEFRHGNADFHIVAFSPRDVSCALMSSTIASEVQGRVR